LAHYLFNKWRDAQLMPVINPHSTTHSLVSSIGLHYDIRIEYQ